MNGKIRITFFSIVLFFSIILLSFTVKADIMLYPAVDYLFSLFLLTFIMNYPVNLVFLTLISFLINRKYEKIIIMPPKKYVFRLLVATAILTFFGAIVDILLVLDPFLRGWGTYGTLSNPNFLIASAIKIIIPMALIFLSFLLISFTVLKLSKKISFFIGIFMAILNMFFWLLLFLINTIPFIISTVIVSTVISIILLTLFVKNKSVAFQH